MAASFEKLLDDNLSTLIMKQGSLVTGIVIDILDNHVVVHVGLKSEAVVPVSEFYNESGELELEVGDEVTGSIDFDRRYAHMKMHTAQHLVSGIAYELFDGVRTVGNQIHTDRSRIDFHPIQFSEEMLLQLQSEVNEKIRQGLEVTDSQMTRDEINAIMPQERTNMDLLPAFINDLRVVTIGERQDMCPCAGTHVRNISEIGEVEFTGKKSKGKGKQRVSYILK